MKKGERLGIIGHNGAGKSTLLKLISRVTAPTDGTISMNGRVASMLEVGTGFHPELTGRENVYMNGAILGMTKKEIDAKMEDIIEFSEVRQFIDTPVKRYSSGMYVKLAFSVAAHLDSEIVIMDEVLAVGDMKFQEKCLTKMNAISKENGRTILYVSHNMNTIRQLCNRVLVLEHGRVVFDGNVEEGIGIYLGLSDQDALPTEYDFSHIKRNYHFGQTMRIKSFRFKDKKVPYFEIGEDMKIETSIDSDIEMDGVQLVLRINDRGNIKKIATSFSEPFSLKKGMNEGLAFQLKTEGIVPDQYAIYIEVIKVDSAGAYFSYDFPDIGLPFQIINKEHAGYCWAKQFWGNVQLESMKLIRE